MTDTKLTDWKGRRAYLEAKAERDKFALYGLDLLWLLVKRQYPNADLTQPSAMLDGDKKPKDNRTAEEIKNDLLKRLKGGENHANNEPVCKADAGQNRI